jgi:hypothetical protein
VMARMCVVLIVLAGFFATGDISAVIRGGTAAVTDATKLAATLSGWCGQFTGSPSIAADRSWDGQTGQQAGQQAGDRLALPEPPRMNQRMNQVAIPADAVRSVTLDDLLAGDRLLVWCRIQPGQASNELLAIDIIDQARGEVLLSRHLRSTGHAAQPQRVQLQARTVQSGQMLTIRPVHGSPLFRQGQEPPAGNDVVGPVIAIKTIHRKPADNSYEPAAT